VIVRYRAVAEGAPALYIVLPQRRYRCDAAACWTTARLLDDTVV